MPTSRITEALIVQRVGEVTASRGWQYAMDDRVLEVEWDAKANALTSVVQGGDARPYRCLVLFLRSPGDARVIASTCSCPMRNDCKHVAATLYEALGMPLDGPGEDGDRDGAASSASSAAGSMPVWRSRIESLTKPSGRAVSTDTRELGIQFRVVLPAAPSRSHSGVQRPALEARPVALGKKGRWGNGGLTWQNLGQHHDTGTPQQRANMRQLAALYTVDFPYLGQGAWLQIDRVRAPLVWSVLSSLAELGVALVLDDRDQSQVELHAAPVTAGIDVVDLDGDLTVAVPVNIDAELVQPWRLGFIGSPATGLFVWDEGIDGVPSRVRLVPLAESVDDAVAQLAMQNPIVVPADEVPEFNREVLPGLRARHAITSHDGSYTLPELPRPVLELGVRHFGHARAEVTWGWRYVAPGEDPASGVRVGLWPSRSDGVSLVRDAPEEARILADLGWVFDAYPHLGVPSASGRRLASVGLLVGVPLLLFLRDALPRLVADHGVIVATSGESVDYRQATQAPTISVSAVERVGNRDWLDLSITVSVGDEDVPFEELLRALAAGEEVLVLDSGTYLGLDAPELARLRALVEEARSLQEHARDGLGISRYHVDLWAELEALGVVDVQAAAWRSALAALADIGQIPARSLPATVAAALRPYQSEGFAWLAHLFAADLGGILADDMGLGKTLQVIALIADERAASGGSAGRRQRTAPWLVVAPASVVHNWAAEIARFAPSLKVVTLPQTTAKRGTPLADEIAGADIVVVSYAIFRFDFDELDTVDFCGLVLDEAQFVKNHQSKAYACARKLRARVKFAVTGTPMENNLLELWSLLSITAPGLFPSPKRFAEFFQRPIEREGDEERLALLRRRVAPFMLRRTKEEVASELPPKQEQVLELDLHPKHRKIYDTQLQRERQRVLGLLDDVDANRFQIFQSLTLLRQLSLDAGLVDEKNSGIPSAKLDALMEMLDDVLAEGHRVLVFSQFTRYLGLARERLDAAGIRYAYLDGRTRKRAEAIESFRSGSMPVFLISLKAGGFGLNLTEADYVVLLDPWWNPATEAQAVDRAHRIGQSRSVMVYRLVSRDTIEEKVMALKAEKAALFEGVMSESGRGTVGLTADDIRDLLS